MSRSTDPTATSNAHRDRSADERSSSVSRRYDPQTIFLAVAMAAACIAAIYFVGQSVWTNGPPNDETEALPPMTLEQIPFDGREAMEWMEKICAIGPRMSGSDGMQQQQRMLIEHFRQLGGRVEVQQLAVRHPLTGDRVDMANLIVRWHPERKQRILLCAHYDTRPFPDRDPDPQQRQGIFLGANDGASGVAVLAVMARSMPQFESPLGIDFCLFDGEEFVFSERDPYFLGSRYFSQVYAADKNRGYEYRAAVLLDMVGDRYLELRKDRNALGWADSRWLVDSIWKKARQLGVREFVDRPMRTTILDDHIMLHDIGGIPAVDIIDFDYRSRDRRQQYWHTRADTPDKCSAESMAKVGYVVLEWLKDVDQLLEAQQN